MVLGRVYIALKNQDTLSAKTRCFDDMSDWWRLNMCGTKNLNFAWTRTGTKK